MLLLVDMDEVIVDFLTAVCYAHNEKTGDSLTPADIDDWELGKFGIEKELWHKPGFFNLLQPLKGAIEALWKAKQLGHNIWIVSNAMDEEYIINDKWEWIKKHIPFVNKVIFTDKKHMFKGDLLIDDCPEYLENYPGTTVKITKPYNREVPADYEFDSLAAAITALA